MNRQVVGPYEVQAREILRIYGDLTSQNETLEWQLKYSLVRLKAGVPNPFPGGLGGKPAGFLLRETARKLKILQDGFLGRSKSTD